MNWVCATVPVQVEFDLSYQNCYGKTRSCAFNNVVVHVNDAISALSALNQPYLQQFRKAISVGKSWMPPQGCGCDFKLASLSKSLLLTAKMLQT